MARREEDREDLMREATALKRRVEMLGPGEPEPIIAGFRSDGSLSLYFGPDPVYHFDPEGRLRRAFVEGDLYRTQGTTLARLRRVRTESATQLQRSDLDPARMEHFLARTAERLQSLQDGLAHGRIRITRQVPEGEDFVPALQNTLHTILSDGPRPAPRIKGKR